MPNLIRDRLRDALDNNGLSIMDLAGSTVIPGQTGSGITYKTVEALLRAPGRIPEMRVLEALSRALNTPIEEFYEYPIVKARAEARERETPEQARRRAVNAAQKAARRKSAADPKASE